MIANLKLPRGDAAGRLIVTRGPGGAARDGHVTGTQAHSPRAVGLGVGSDRDSDSYTVVRTRLQSRFLSCISHEFWSFLPKNRDVY